MPRRIQLRRVNGWRMPIGAVNVARPGRWGNPFRVTPSCPPDQAVRNYRRWLAGELGSTVLPRPSLDTIRRLLGGRDLACWCAPGAPCHADVLLELANAEEAPDAP